MLGEVCLWWDGSYEVKQRGGGGGRGERGKCEEEEEAEEREERDEARYREDSHSPDSRSSRSHWLYIPSTARREQHVREWREVWWREGRRQKLPHSRLLALLYP